MITAEPIPKQSIQNTLLNPVKKLPNKTNKQTRHFPARDDHLHGYLNSSPAIHRAKELQRMANESPIVKRAQVLQRILTNSPSSEKARAWQRKADKFRSIESKAIPHERPTSETTTGLLSIINKTSHSDTVQDRNIPDKQVYEIDKKHVALNTNGIANVGSLKDKTTLDIGGSNISHGELAQRICATRSNTNLSVSSIQRKVSDFDVEPDEDVDTYWGVLSENDISRDALTKPFGTLPEKNTQLDRADKVTGRIKSEGTGKRRTTNMGKVTLMGKFEDNAITGQLPVKFWDAGHLIADRFFDEDQKEEAYPMGNLQNQAEFFNQKMYNNGVEDEIANRLAVYRYIDMTVKLTYPSDNSFTVQNLCDRDILDEDDLPKVDELSRDTELTIPSRIPTNWVVTLNNGPKKKKKKKKKKKGKSTGFLEGFEDYEVSGFTGDFEFDQAIFEVEEEGKKTTLSFQQNPPTNIDFEKPTRMLRRFTHKRHLTKEEEMEKIRLEHQLENIEDINRKRKRISGKVKSPEVKKKRKELTEKEMGEFLLETAKLQLSDYKKQWDELGKSGLQEAYKNSFDEFLRNVDFGGMVYQYYIMNK